MSSRFHFYFSVLYASIIIPTQCLGDKCLPRDHVALFIFGDSFVSVGNNNYINTTIDLQKNCWPYGETFFKYSTGRVSNGRLIPDFIAEYAKLPLIPPYLHPGYNRYSDGANFASTSFDVGNNNYINTTIDYQVNFWPYGETFFKYPTGRHSNGRLIPDFIAEYANLPLIPPYLHPGYNWCIDGANFASGGAGVLVETLRGLVIDLDTQLNYFKNMKTMLRQQIGEKEVKALLVRAVYLISIGINDYSVSFTSNSSVLQSYSQEEYVNMVIGNLRTVIKCLAADICLPKDHVALFVFGDSAFDVGNNNYINTTTNYQVNFWPYGESFFKYPTGRFSNGRIISDFIAEYANLPLIPPYLHPGYNRYIDGTNFASGGAGALVETHRGLVIDLNTQLNYFKNMKTKLRQQLGKKKTKTLLVRAVYLISIGNNDYLALFNPNSTVLQSYSKEEYVNMVIGNLTTVIKEIYKKGGRKYVFLGLPPLGCIPSERALKQGACMEEILTLVKLHNKVLSEVLSKLVSQLKGFKYAIADFYTFLSERMDNPSKYGM
ncbi:gdsl esterase/lipase 5 [Fagus crenata]